MKKKNIFLFILLGLITLGFNTKVLADDGIIGLLECKYKFDDSSAINQDYIDDNGVVSFYYSELSTKNDSLNGNVMKHTDSLNRLYRAVNSFNEIARGELGFSATQFTKNLKNADATFKNSVAQNGECPKYIMLKYSGKTAGTKDYTPYFDNNTERCGADLSGCPVIGNLVPEWEKYMIYPG